MRGSRIKKKKDQMAKARKEGKKKRNSRNVAKAKRRIEATSKKIGEIALRIKEEK